MIQPMESLLSSALKSSALSIATACRLLLVSLLSEGVTEYSEVGQLWDARARLTDGIVGPIDTTSNAPPDQEEQGP